MTNYPATPPQGPPDLQAAFAVRHGATLREQVLVLTRGVPAAPATRTRSAPPLSARHLTLLPSAA